MKRLPSFLLLLLLTGKSLAQNLVPNPGFETYSALPTGPAQYNLSTGWTNCMGSGSPDYFSTLGSGLVQLPNCFVGTVNPNSGDGCMGACFYYYSPLDFREYLSTQLTSPLVPGQTYTVSFFVTNGVTSGTYGGGGIDNISVAFSMQPLVQTGTGNIPVTPQVTYGSIYYSYSWQLLSMQFVADSAYEYMTIGNFTTDALTAYQQFDPCPNYGAYYFFDDLTVEATNVAPIALFSAPNHICPGTCTDFNNLSTNATSFTWLFTGANPSTSTDINPTNICYNSPGNYTVQLIASNTVTSDTLTLNNYITVYPYPPPQGINQSGDTLFANPGAVSYQWYQDGVLIPGATNDFFVASVSGNYNVVATDPNGCEVEAAIFDVIAAITSPGNPGDEFSIFPNPFEDHIKINLNAREEVVTLSVFSIPGQLILQKPVSPTSETDLSTLNTGTYFLEIISGSKTFHSVICKQ